MKTEYIREFVVLANKLSYTSAASALHISHSALTRHIQTLEGELGAQLVSRSTHSVALTPEGAEFLPYARKIAAEIEQATAAVKDIALGKSGKLSFGALYYAINNFAVPLLNQASRVLPNLQVEIKSFQPDTLLSAMLSGGIDVALTCYKYVGLPNARHLYFSDDGLGVLCRTGSEFDRSSALDGATRKPNSSPQALNISKLAGHEFVAPFYELEYRIYSDYMVMLAQAGAKVEAPLECNNVDLLPAYVRKTGKPSIIHSCMSQMGANGLTFVPINRRQISSKMYLVYLADSDNQSVPRFLEIVRQMHPNSKFE